MTQLTDLINEHTRGGGEAFQRISIDANGLATDQFGNTVSTTTTSGIVKMKAPGVVHIISALGDGSGIIYLPPAGSCPGGICVIMATTGATGGDISVYDEETGAEHTDGDMDADLDYAAFISNGIAWGTIVDGVA